ncbi:MAG: adenylate/guanylate cyclase domain-containing protein, partial [Candidatus Xenobia bacterium]
ELGANIRRCAKALQQSGADSAAYRTASDRLHGFLEFYAEQSGYDDLFLIQSPSGRCVLALHDPSLLGQTLTRKSEVGRIFDDARTLMDVQVSGFEHDAANHSVFTYIGAPVMEHGSIAGVVALRMNCKQIEDVAADYAGLGQTGETEFFTIHDRAAMMVTGVRSNPNAAFTVKIPVDSSQFPPSYQSAMGNRGFGFTTDHAGHPVLAAWRYEPTFDLGMVVKLDRAEALTAATTARRYVALLGLICIVGAVTLATIISKRVAGPLVHLAKEADAIGHFHLDPQPVAHSAITEVDHLAVEMEDMKTSLRSFAKYVPAEVVRQVLTSGREARIEGEHRTLSVYFSDIANFTSISEGLTPEQLVELLAEYLGTMSDQILESGGTVDKYIGDAVMAFWGAPQSLPQHALVACRTALANQRRLAQLREKWAAEGRPQIHARIGLHTGEVVVGNVGSSRRLSYTVMGDTVNLASRLESLSKYYGTSILISEKTYTDTGGEVIARPLDWVSVKGKTEGVLIYELLGLPEDPNASELQSLAERWRSALTLYRARDWEKTIAMLEETPQDGPGKLIIERCHHYIQEPPPELWDGVWKMTVK